MAAQICETCKKKGGRCYCAPNSTCKGYEKRIITQFEKFQLMDIEKLSEWLDKNGQFDSSPWMNWWNECYCNKCPSETGYITDFGGEYEWQTPCEFAWCELHDKCKFFQNMDEVPDNKEIIKMWLESEVE